MNIKHAELEIDPDDPFKNDALGRQESSEILTQLVESEDGPFVLTIDSSWGSGKTTFIKMWIPLLEKQNYNCLYFNAWENDFADDALISFIGEMQTAFEAFKSKNKSQIDSHIEIAKKIGGRILKRSLPAAIKLLTYGVVDAQGDIEKTLADFAGEVVSERLENYAEDKKSLENFRDNLGELVSLLSDGDVRRPLVFFVDELDRCRPNFAIELLERVKHLFTVEGIIFVLALDKEQLACSIKTLYGADMNAEGYLRRFFDLEYRLPAPKTNSYPNYLVERFGVEQILVNKKVGRLETHLSHIKDTFAGLSPSFDLSLRDIEKCFAYILIYIQISNDGDVHPLILMVALVILKIGSPQLYKDFVENKSGVDAVIDKFKSSTISKNFIDDENYGWGISAYLTYGSMSFEERQKHIETIGGRLSGIRGREDQKLSVTFNILRELSESPELLYKVIRKIEVGERFK